MQLEHIIGAVDSFKPPLLTVKTVLNAKEQDKRVAAFSQLMCINSEWHVRKLLNVSQHLKEFESLHFVEDLILANNLIIPEEYGYVPSFYKLPQKLFEELNAVYDNFQISAIKQAMQRHGITLVTGEAGTGKSEVMAGIIEGLVNVIDESEIMAPKKYTIKELLEENDSDYEDDYMKNPITKGKLNPWLKKGAGMSELSPEDLKLEKSNVSYQKADKTDQKIILKKKDASDYKPPNNILVCCNTSKSVDNLMHKLLQLNGI